MLTFWINPKNSKKTETTTTYNAGNLKDYDTNSLYKLYGGGTGSGGGGGGYSVAKADISKLLASYDQQAASARQVAESKYTNTRNDLLTSLKRFQDQNARDVQNQKTSYLSEQASLESAREQANRQSRISAAARGLGGSGLQQLAQLQNLLGQSEQISKSAGTNQQAMDKLATLLREFTEDNETKMKQNEQERANTLNSIASSLATQKAQAIAQNEQAYVNAVNQARAQAAAARASYSSNNTAARQTANKAAGALSALQQELNSTLSQVAGMSKKELKKTYKTDNINTIKNSIKKEYLADLASLQEYYGFDRGTLKTAQGNINSLLNGLNTQTITYGTNAPLYDSSFFNPLGKRTL